MGREDYIPSDFFQLHEHQGYLPALEYLLSHDISILRTVSVPCRCLMEG